MYPIFPTIDLKEENVYDLKESTQIGLKTDHIKHNHIQTFFHINDDELKDEQEVTRLIMFAFGNAYAQAQILNNNKVK